MPNKLKLPALDADVIIDGDTVSITSNDGTAIRIGIEEWEDLRESLRLDATVDYEDGETPMTGLQFHSAVQMTRQAKSLKAEIEKLKGS